MYTSGFRSAFSTKQVKTYGKKNARVISNWRDEEEFVDSDKENTDKRDANEDTTDDEWCLPVDKKDLPKPKLTKAKRNQIPSKIKNDLNADLPSKKDSTTKKRNTSKAQQPKMRKQTENTINMRSDDNMLVSHDEKELNKKGTSGASSKSSNSRKGQETELTSQTSKNSDSPTICLENSHSSVTRDSYSHKSNIPNPSTPSQSQSQAHLSSKSQLLASPAISPILPMAFNDFHNINLHPIISSTPLQKPNQHFQSSLCLSPSVGENLSKHQTVATPVSDLSPNTIEMAIDSLSVKVQKINLSPLQYNDCSSTSEPSTPTAATQVHGTDFKHIQDMSAISNRSISMLSPRETQRLKGKCEVVISPKPTEKSFRAKESKENGPEDEGVELLDEAKVCITLRDVLASSRQLNPVSWEKYLGESLPFATKLAEATFSEVYVIPHEEHGDIAMKVIPFGNPDVFVNGEPQRTTEQVYQEIEMTRILSDVSLSPEGATGLQQDSGFIHLIRPVIIQGSYHPCLLSAWDAYADVNPEKAENDRPDYFDSNQLYCVLLMELGGTDLESWKFKNVESVKGFALQVIASLRAAEEDVKFEHRDLHWGNILIKSTNKESIEVTFSNDIKNKDNNSWKIPTGGLETRIIDFTLSRLEKDNRVFHVELVDLFDGEGDPQFDVYRQMRELTKGKWKEFYPKTNVLWIYYVLTKLNLKLSDFSRSIKQTKSFKKLKKELSDLMKYIAQEECDAMSRVWDAVVNLGWV